MSIEDNSPERKNLMITSVAFIIYYYGNAEVDGNTLSLPFINIKFHNADLLVYMAWASLFWFIYRFNLIHGRDFLNEFPKEFIRYKEDSDLRSYILKQAKLDESKVSDFHCLKLRWKPINIYVLSSFKLKGGGSQTIRVERNLFDDAKGTIIGLKLTFRCFIQNLSFSQSLAPYVLAILALTAPFFN